MNNLYTQKCKQGKYIKMYLPYYITFKETGGGSGGLSVLSTKEVLDSVFFLIDGLCWEHLK